jgi:hypothetical protein
MEKRGRPKSDEPSVRLRLGEGNIRLGVDPEIDELYKRIEALPRGTRFRTVMTWLITGSKMEAKLPNEDLSEIRQAADDIVDNFVF